MSSPNTKSTKNNNSDTQQTINNNSSIVGNLPPRKRARTDAEKEQRRIERILRNRKAAHASREKKRKHVAKLESYVKLLESNLNEIYQNQSLLFNKLSENNIKIDNNLLLIEKIQRPNDLLLSDEEQNINKDDKEEIENENENENETESNDESNNDEQKVNEPVVENIVEPVNKKIKLESSIDSSPVLSPSNPSLDSQLNMDLDFQINDLPSLTPSLYSSTSSPSKSIQFNDLSLPSTPIDDDFDNNSDNLLNFTLDDDSINSNDFISLNTFEPDFNLSNTYSYTNSNINNYDETSIDPKENDNDDSKMGFFGLFNSVHSAVMHFNLSYL